MLSDLKFETRFEILSAIAGEWDGGGIQLRFSFMCIFFYYFHETFSGCYFTGFKIKTVFTDNYRFRNVRNIPEESASLTDRSIGYILFTYDFVH